MLYLGFAFAVAEDAGGTRTPDRVDTRAENAILREYFLQRYHQMQGGQGGVYPGIVGTTDPLNATTDPMAEYFVDRNVARFIDDLEDNLGAMKSTLAELKEARAKAVALRTERNPSTLETIKALASRIGEKAGKISKMVGLVIMDLRPAKKVEKPVDDQASEFLAGEVQTLQLEVTKAEERINSIFLAPTNVVTVNELQGDNLQTELKSIQTVTKDITRTVDNSDRAE